MTSKRVQRLLRVRCKLHRSQKGLCYYCGGPMTNPKKKTSSDNLRCSLEHLLMRAQGGRLIQSNLVAAHASCNSNRKDLCPWQHKENKGRSVNEVAEYGWCPKVRKHPRERRKEYAAIQGLHPQEYQRIFNI